MADSKSRYLVRSADPEDPNDIQITRDLGDAMRQSGPHRHTPRREGGREEYAASYRENRRNQCTLLAFRDDEPVGMLGGSVSFLLGLEYILALCIFLYVRPDARDGRSAMVLMAAFRQWAEQRGADEVRFQIASDENVEKSHEMFVKMGCYHTGGNYIYALSEKAQKIFPLDATAAKSFDRAIPADNTQGQPKRPAAKDQASHRYLVRIATPEDRPAGYKLGEAMRQSGPYRNIPQRPNWQQEREAQVDEEIRTSNAYHCRLLALRDDEAVGMLVGSISYLFGLDYLMALCHLVYVDPSMRDGKAALLLISAFRQWAEQRKIDELRFQVTSSDHAHKSHEMFKALGFRHIGGNYSYPLSEQGRQALPLDEQALKAFPQIPPPAAKD